MLKNLPIFISYLMSTKQEAENGAGASTYVDEGEILDEVITRSRGEFRHVSSPKITSSTATPANDPENLQSPRRSYSPRVSELRGQHSPLARGRGLHSPRTAEVTPVRLSKLGKSPSTPSK